MPDAYFGKYTGVVGDNRDPENLGRLRVIVPAIFPSGDTVMARPALPYGVFFVPEIGSKVWVEFESGDPGLPLWTGVQYEAGEWPAEARVDPPQKRVIKSPSGHLLILNDRGGEEGIEISSNARIVIRSLGLIEIQAPSVAINGRPVVPLANPI